MMIICQKISPRQLLRVSLLLMLVFCSFSPLTSQEDRLYVDRLGSQQGFSANYVTCSFQDDDGFMWFGTFAGLNRYDGYEVKEFKPDPQDSNSISGIRIFSITDDEKGNLWIGTTGKGLNYYNRSTNNFQRITHDPADPQSIRSNTINVLLSDKKGRLWVGTNKGLSVLKKFREGAEPEFVHISLPDPSKPFFIHSLFEDASGNIWFAAQNSLFRVVDDDEMSLRRIDLKNIGNINATSIVQLASGELLLGCGAGLFMQQSADSEAFRFVGHLTGINALAYDREIDQLWIGASTGLYKYSVGRNGEMPEELEHYTYDALDPRSLSNNDITTLTIDETRIIWAGTSGGGINKFDPFRKHFYHHKDVGGAAATIRALYRDSEQRIWVGSDGGGIELSDGPLPLNEKSTFRHFQRPRRVYSIIEINNEVEHAMYFGSNSGPGLFRADLNREDISIEPIREVTGSVFAMLEDSRGAFWIGNYFDGLMRWTPDPEAEGGYVKTRIGETGGNELPSQIIRSLEEDKAGNIWVGTGDGLVFISSSEAAKADPSHQSYKNIPEDRSSLSNSYILPIYTATDGTVWIGTFGGGINKYMPATEGESVSFKSYGESDGLVDGVIKAITEDQSGNLWISSNRGISRFDPRKEKFENFDINDGLQGDEFGELAVCTQADGSIIFGGVNGFTAFYPESIKLNAIPARPVITGLSILNKPVEVGEERDGQVVLPQAISNLERINLIHSHNSVSFQLGALHYASPEKNRFAYKLDGFDKDWIFTSARQRVATYTNLPAGNYTFMLKVSNNDKVWNEEVLTLGVVVQPPFWRTNAAYFLYLLLFVGFLYLLRRYSIIDIEEKNRIELKKVNQEKTEELNQLKLQFFTNISHEFRTPLTLISGPLESLIRNQSSLQPEQRNQYYHLMYKNSKYLLRLVNELLDFRRLDQGKLSLRVSKNDVVEHIEGTVAPFEFLATKKDINFRVVAEERPITTWFAPEILEKVLFNLLSNAFKFTPEGGDILLAIEKINQDDPRFKKHLPGYGTLLITVKDSGVGISDKKLRRIFDRFYKGAQEDSMNREGAGIGLAYAQSLVDLHRGLIDVKSSLGKGTTFYLRLPLDKTVYQKSELEQRDLSDYVPQADPVDYFMPEENNKEEELNALQLGAGISPQQEDSDDSSLLLYIDDNPDLRNYIRHTFANDFRVIAADSGEAGLELALTSSPDIIVSDLMMPGMDGIEVLDKLKSNPQTSHIPVILLTAKDTEESRLEGLRYGADGYVTKPFDQEALLQQILNIVQHRDILRDRFRREVITEPAEVTVTDSDELFLRQAMDIVEENMSNTEFSVDQLVKEMGVSRSKLYLKLKALTGQSSSEFVRTVRLKRAVQLLENSNYSVKEVMYMTGFNTASYFSKCFKRQFGIVPSEYVSRNKQSKK
ncbi:hybrid sensor histidine kinase/response regulator transcription factor [Neolewinella aurantiaca]|nr:two-component regulator propeller domain-containing protein [Neolewinella aurantiaca]